MYQICAGNKQYSEHLYLRAAIFVHPLCELIMTGQCLWKFLTSRFWLFWSMSRFSEDSDLTYSMSFSQIGAEVETISAGAVCTDRMYISVPGMVGPFWRLSGPASGWRHQGFLQKCDMGRKMTLNYEASATSFIIIHYNAFSLALIN